MILNDYTKIVQDSVDDYSSRAGNVIEQQIKEKYQEILRYTAKWLVGTSQEVLTASTSVRYVTPSEFFQIKDVQYKTDNDYTQLTPIEEYDYLQKVNADAGTPTGWYVEGQKIYFDKIPNSAGSVLVTYIPAPEELVGTTTSLIPSRFTDVLVTGAIAGFKAYERLPDAREYESTYKGSFARQGRIEGILGSMIQELASNQRGKKIKFWNR